MQNNSTNNSKINNRVWQQAVHCNAYFPFPLPSVWGCLHWLHAKYQLTKFSCLLYFTCYEMTYVRLKDTVTFKIHIHQLWHKLHVHLNSCLAILTGAMMWHLISLQPVICYCLSNGATDTMHMCDCVCVMCTHTVVWAELDIVNSCRLTSPLSSGGWHIITTIQIAEKSVS